MDKDEKISEPIWRDLQCNLSALMYLLSEQQTLIGKLMGELVRVGALNNTSLERITSAKNDMDTLTPVYKALHERFTTYFVAVNLALVAQDDLKENLDDKQS